MHDCVKCDTSAILNKSRPNIILLVMASGNDNIMSWLIADNTNCLYLSCLPQMPQPLLVHTSELKHKMVSKVFLVE